MRCVRAARWLRSFAGFDKWKRTFLLLDPAWMATIFKMLNSLQSHNGDYNISLSGGDAAAAVVCCLVRRQADWTASMQSKMKSWRGKTKTMARRGRFWKNQRTSKRYLTSQVSIVRKSVWNNGTPTMVCTGDLPRSVPPAGGDTESL